VPAPSNPGIPLVVAPPAAVTPSATVTPPQVELQTNQPSVATPPPGIAIAPVAKPAAPPAPPVVKLPPPANGNFAGKSLGFKPVEAPPLPVSAQKEAELRALLARYMADQISPSEYQKERAAILAGP
jgi:hypothetical protein